MKRPGINRSRKISTLSSLLLARCRNDCRICLYKMTENYKHTTVLLDEAVNGLNIRPDGIYIDGTFGRGGHSRLILSAWRRGTFTGNRSRSAGYCRCKTITDPRFSIVHGPFSALADYVAERGLTGKIDGILLDPAFLHRSSMTQSAVSRLCVTVR